MVPGARCIHRVLLTCEGLACSKEPTEPGALRRSPDDPAARGVSPAWLLPFR